MIMTMVD